MENKGLIIGIVMGVITFMLILLLCGIIRTVPTGYVGIKTIFGKVQKDVVQEGINLKKPFIEKIVKIDCRTKKIEIESGSASRDLQDVSLKTVVNYSVNKETANKLFQEVGTDYENVLVKPAILESIKSITAQYTAEQLITNRKEVATSMQNTLKKKIENKGFNIVDLSITDLNFSEAYNKAIEKKQVAQQNAQKAKYELEQAKIDNEKKIENAKAEAEVMKRQNKEITDKTLKLKELENQENLIKKWDGKMPSTVTGDTKTLFNLGK